MEMLLYTLCGVHIGSDSDKDALITKAHAEYPWMPETKYMFTRGKKVRQFVGGHYPKLSAWLFDRPDDLSRLKCAVQVQRLKRPAKPVTLRASEDQREMRKARSDQRAASASYRLARDAFKSNQRSAWNVCKA